MKKETKKIIIIAGIVIVLVVVAAAFLGGDKNEPVQTGLQSQTRGVAVGASAPAAVNEQAIGQEFLRLLSNVRNLNIDTTIFSNPSFLGLKDFDVEIVRLNNEGRSNPFAPIGFEGSSSLSLPSSPSVETEPDPQGENIIIEELAQ
jgi:hypothetical protein